jgi:hypothetical protein
MNPNSVARLSDKSPTHGVQLEEKMERNKKKRKRMALESGEAMGDGGEEDGMNIDEKSGEENAADADEEMGEDESEDEGYAGDMTFTTPRIKITGMAVDSDAEMGDASGSEQENSFSLQTPFLPRRHGKRTKSNVTLRASSVTTLNPRKDVQDARLKVDTTSPARPLPPHLAPQLSAITSTSSWRSASTTLSTLGGGDSLMTGDGSEREEIETPLSPDFPSPIAYPVGTSSTVAPPFPIPDVDASYTMPVGVRGKRLFPRNHATSTRSRPTIQSVAITSSSSGGASSRASSRTRGSGKSQGLHPVARRKNIGGLGPTRMGVLPAAKCTENVPISMPIPIPMSDSEGARKGEKRMKGVTGADAEKDTHSDPHSFSKRQKISSTSLRKTSSLDPKAKPPLKQRLVAPQKPIRISRSTSSGTSSSASGLGRRTKVGFVGSGKSAVRTTRARGGGAGSANENGGQRYSN